MKAESWSAPRLRKTTMARQRIRLQQTNWAVADRLHRRVKGPVIERLQEQFGHSIKKQLVHPFWDWSTELLARQFRRDVLSQAVEQTAERQ